MTDTTNGAAPLFEAPASVTVKIDYKGYTGILFTLRGHSGGEVLQKLDAAIAWLDEHGAVPTSGHGNGNGSAPAPTPVAANEDGENYFDAIRYTIGPDDKKPERVILSLFAAGREHAETRVMRVPEKIAELLGDVGPATFGTFQIPCRVYFTWGAVMPNSPNGNRYKNVTRVTPLAAG